MTYDEALQEIEESVHDCLGDNPEAGEDDAFHDIAIGFFYRDDIPQDVKRDLARCQLGWDPELDKDLYVLYGIDQA